jgi:acetoin:2,6-dichlorophenolindophenol oxidoreductase subunit beta
MPRMRYAEALREALRQEMLRDPHVVLYGEDIGTYGGVFKVTRGLQEEFGALRVRDTPIAESALAGMTVGAAMAGLRPVLEIMYADFLPLVLDTLVNQASALPGIWPGQISLPLVIRTQGGGGAGAGAQHSKSFDGLMAHIPGLKVVSPATPVDAKTLLSAAIRDPNPVIVLEHKLLYNLVDEVPESDAPAEIGRAQVLRPGRDVTVIANSRMVHEALLAAKQLDEADGIGCEVIDLRTLRPLDRATILQSVRRTSRAVVVNEDWRTGGFGAEVSATIAEEAFEYLDAPVCRIGTHDRPIAYSQPLEEVALPNAAAIMAGVRMMAAR